MFTQHVNLWKKKMNGQRTTTTKVMNHKEWIKRLKEEKELFDCQRKIFMETRKQDLSMACRGTVKEENIGNSFHVPLLVIEAPFDIKKPEK